MSEEKRFETIEDYWRANPASEEQMHRWLGCRDGFIHVIAHWSPELGSLRERLRLTPLHHVRRRAALQQRIGDLSRIIDWASDHLSRVRNAYEASREGRPLSPGDRQP